MTNTDVYNQVLQLFEGNENAAMRWYHEPNRALQWRSPEEVIDRKGGEKIVFALIVRIEHGVYS